MVFSSTLFLCFFLPVFFGIYFIADKKFKNTILVIGSCIFYAWGAPKFIFVILGTTLLDYFLVKKMHQIEQKRKRLIFLLCSISVNLGLLFYFKYSNFFIENVNVLLGSFNKGQIKWAELVLPIGISFYTFETLTYVIDVYRRVHKPLENFKDYLLYIILFPKLIAGPIIRYNEIADQIKDRSSRDTVDYKLTGFYRFCIGLGKKVLIANTLATLANQVYGADGIPGMDPEQISLSTAWIAAFAYTFQLYFDFSGYSDMALGLAKMLGFKFPENFNNPYVSGSITEFWRRWHITLGNWMRNYLYIPLGGNKVKSKARLYFNLWLVFILSGLWHGAAWSFILWGVWHGMFLVLERIFLGKILERLPKIIQISYTFILVTLGWVMFRVENVNSAFHYIQAMFINWSSLKFIEVSVEQWFTFIIAVLFAFFCAFEKGRSIQVKIYSDVMSLKLSGLMAIVSILLFLLSLSYITASGFNPFIYFRF